MFVNLGCGNHRAPAPWVNIDQYEGPGVYPDLIADAAALPFADNSVERMYVGHLLEHLEWDSELSETLAEIRRVLSGVVCFVGPDLDRAEASDDPDVRILIPSIRDGNDRWPGDRHLWESTASKTLEAVRDVFPGAIELDLGAAAERFPVVAVTEWQFAIEAA